MALPRNVRTEVKTHQRGVTHLYFRVDESAISGNTNAGLLEGKHDATIQKNGTGDYTITLLKASRRLPVVLGAAPVGLADARFNIAAISATQVRIVWEVSGTDTNADFHLALATFEEDVVR